jgi:hypothetical protein
MLTGSPIRLPYYGLRRLYQKALSDGPIRLSDGPVRVLDGPIRHSEPLSQRTL